MIENRTRSSKAASGILAAAAGILSFSCLLPIVYSLAVSFSSKTAVSAGLVSFWPVDFTTYAYREILKEIA